MITFRTIDKNNFYPLLELDPGDGGKFVASAAVSLAEAWLYYEAHDTYPFAVYHGEELVGYMMAHEDMSRKALFLWRLAIAREHRCPPEVHRPGPGERKVRLRRHRL